MAAKKKASARKATKKSSTRKTSSKRTTKKRAASRRAAAVPKSSDDFPRRIYAIASPRSIGQVSMFEPGVMADADNVGNFVSDDAMIERAIHLLQDANFEVHQATSLMINFSGDRKTFEAAFGADLVLVERDVIKYGEETSSTHIDCTATDIDGLVPVEGTRFEEVLEGVAIEEPMYVDAATALPPVVDYWHLTMPGDVSLGLNADRAHRGGITGTGVTVAMVDTGFETHPYFTDRGYRIDPTVLGPGTANADRDEHGHGTGEAANIFAIAPDVRLKPVKTATASGALVNTTAAFNAAVDLGPDIITNSWGASIRFGPLSAARQAMSAAIAAAVAGGTTVVFSAGNGPSFGFPGQHPDVISVGGVFMHQDGALEASNYATGFVSNIYPDRRVPDVSGLVGMMPRAAYLMLPIPAGCIIDTGSAGGSHPTGDETAGDDGWAAFSGTSASAPQIAGACALMKQACRRLAPAELRSILMSTARDVTSGTNAMGNAATAGPDTAVGNGLVDAHRAVLIAKLRCTVTPLPPIRPPFPPVRPPFPPIRPPFPPIRPPFPPVQPPFRPPLVPFRPPTVPFRPPLVPFRPPVRPFAPPVQPLAPLRPFAPLDPGPFDAAEQPFDDTPQSGGALSPEDIALLEQMIIDADDPSSL